MDTATVRKNENIKLIGRLGGKQCLLHRAPRRLRGEIIFKRTAVHRAIALSRPHKDTSNRRLTASSSQILHDLQCHSLYPFVLCRYMVINTGFWATCGCLSPAYTFNFRYICLPSLVFGSMPKMASSTMRVGRIARTRRTP